MFGRNDLDELVGCYRQPAVSIYMPIPCDRARGDPAPGDDDLLDYAAVMTLRQGGNVTVVDRAQLPPTGPAAAILRY